MSTSVTLPCRIYDVLLPLADSNDIKQKVQVVRHSLRDTLRGLRKAMHQHRREPIRQRARWVRALHLSGDLASNIVHRTQKCLGSKDSCLRIIAAEIRSRVARLLDFLSSMDKELHDRVVGMCGTGLPPSGMRLADLSPAMAAA